MRYAGDRRCIGFLARYARRRGTRFDRRRMKSSLLTSRESEDALCDHVALNLVGAGVDRTCERELEAFEPIFALGGAAGADFDLAPWADQIESCFVHVDVEFGPEEFIGTGFCAHLFAFEHT